MNYTPGTRVEVFVDRHWVPGVVDQINISGKLIDVCVLLDDGTRQLQLVDPRNYNIRLAGG